jgi:predicted dehydrogenase
MGSLTHGSIKVACAGAGYFGQFHYDAWRRIDGVQIVAALALTREDAAKTGHPAFDDLEAMLEQTRPDLLDIVTPPPTHLRFIGTAAAHGVKTIICQKPFCQSLAEAREAAALCEKAGVTLVVHDNYRFQPWYRTIRKALDEGRIGALHQVTFRLRPGDGQGPRAYLDRQPYFQTMPRFLVHETAVHWIDTFRYLMGTPD